MSTTALDILHEVVTVLDLPGGIETVEALSLGRSTDDVANSDDYVRFLAALHERRSEQPRVELTITPVDTDCDVSLYEAAMKLALVENPESAIPTNRALLCGE